MVAICLLVKVRNVCVGDRGEAGARMVPGHHINNTAEDTRLTHYTTTCRDGPQHFETENMGMFKTHSFLNYLSVAFLIPFVANCMLCLAS